MDNKSVQRILQLTSSALTSGYHYPPGATFPSSWWAKIQLTPIWQNSALDTAFLTVRTSRGVSPGLQRKDNFGIVRNLAGSAIILSFVLPFAPDWNEKLTDGNLRAISDHEDEHHMLWVCKGPYWHVWTVSYSHWLRFFLKIKIPTCWSYYVGGGGEDYSRICFM